MKRTVLPLSLLATLPWVAVTSCAAPDDQVAPSAQEAGEITADALVDGWIATLGGMETYGALKSARFTLTTEMWDTAGGRIRRTRPRYVSVSRSEAGEATRIERWEGNDLISQGWDGSSGWATLNGVVLAEGDKDFDQVPYVSGDVNYWISLPFKLRDPGVNLTYRGLDLGWHLVTVSFGEGVGLHDGDNWRYWFDGIEPWPVQVAYREEGRENWNVLRFEDIRTVDGYTFVGRRVHFNERGQTTKVLYTHDFELNPDLSGDIFINP